MYNLCGIRDISYIHSSNGGTYGMLEDNRVYCAIYAQNLVHGKFMAGTVLNAGDGCAEAVAASMVEHDHDCGMSA